MTAWLLAGSSAWALLWLAGDDPSVARVLDVVGMGMLIPMPPLWASDVFTIASNAFRVPAVAITQSIVQRWETALFAVGLHVALGVPRKRAALVAWAASGVYVLLSSRVVR